MFTMRIIIVSAIALWATSVSGDIWDGGVGNFTDDNWDGGMPHPGVIVGETNIELDNEVVQIQSGTVNSNQMRIRTAGGTFEVADAELNVTATASLAGLDIGALSKLVGATTATFSNATVTVEGAGSSGRSLFVRNASTLLVDGGTLTVTHANVKNPFRATLEIESDGIVTITGDAEVTAQVLRIDNASTGLLLQSGTITLNNAHAFRSVSAFNGQLNFTGEAGASSVVHTDLTDANIIRHLAGRVTNSFFAIDGITIETSVIYDGTNIADINAELETLAVGGRFLRITEDAGVQTLTLEGGGGVLKGDVNQDGLINLLDVGPFVTVLTNGEFQAEADVNCDGEVNLLDVGPFVELLSGGG